MTLVNFVPSTKAAFQFQATFNGTPYNVVVTWNVFGQRFYINVYDLSGNLILCRALSGTGPVLLANFSWIPSVATASTLSNHNVPIGTPVKIQAAQTGTLFDGSFQALSTGPTKLTYALNNPNQPLPVSGQVQFPLNLVQGYGPGWLLTFNEATQQFQF